MQLSRCSTLCRLALAVLASSSIFSGQTRSHQRGVQDAVPAGTSAEAPAAYYALVIGNNVYKYFDPLGTAVNDATAVAQLLHDKYGFKTRLLTNANRAVIMQALADYRSQLTDSSSLLIYYAGHGYNDRDEGEAYWIPVDAQRDSQGNWISADDITHAVRAMPAQHVLIISDSCYSGGLTRDIDSEVRLGARKTFLAKMLSSKSRTLMSSGGDEPVADSGGQGHSVFALALLQGLNEMEDKQFAAEDLFYRKIQQRVGGGSQQVPEYKTIRDSGHVAGDFVFARILGIASPADVAKSGSSKKGKTTGFQRATGSSPIASGTPAGAGTAASEQQDAVGTGEAPDGAGAQDDVAPDKHVLSAAAKLFHSRGKELISKKQYAEAVKALSEGIELEPEFSSLYLDRGYAYFHSGDLDRAMRDYNQALSLPASKHNHAITYNDRGLIYFSRGQYDLAIQDYNDALKLKPDYATPFYNRGKAYAKKEDYRQSIEDFDSALKLKPDFTDAQKNRDQVAARLGKSHARKE